MSSSSMSSQEAKQVAQDIGRFTWGTPLRRCLSIAVVWRVLLAIIGIIAHFLTLPGTATFSLLKVEGWSSNPITLALDSSVRYSLIFAEIAKSGYTNSTTVNSTIHVYPLYPILVKVGAWVIGDVYLSGIAISNALLIASVVLLWYWLRSRKLEKCAPVCTVLVLVNPGSIFYGFMYSESLFLALALAVFILWEHERWYWASACAFLLVLSRPTGIIVIPTIIAMVIASGKTMRWRPWLPVIGGIAASLAFAWYQYVIFGTPLAAVRAATVGRGARSFHQGFLDLTLQASPGHPVGALAFLLLTVLAYVAVLPLVYRYLGVGYTLFAALAIAIPISNGLYSSQRYLAVAFPVAAAVALWRKPMLIFSVLVWQFWFTVAAAALFVSEGGAF
jgi:hypothetical protein